jgi:hypothetical protein
LLSSVARGRRQDRACEAPLHRRTENIAALADPIANGEGAQEIETFTLPDKAGGATSLNQTCARPFL